MLDTSSSKTTEARNVYVGFKDRDRVQAKLIGWDVYDDVALLKVDPSAHPLAPVPLGDSSLVRAGDPVAAMGSPFGNEDSITTGVVSAIRRSIASLTSIYKVVDAIQIDAPITHGNSGGPLFDARGRVIGINAQIRTETGGAEGVGFAIPINAARRSMTQLAATGRVVYAYLGVTTEDLTPTLARHLGYERDAWRDRRRGQGRKPRGQGRCPRRHGGRDLQRPVRDARRRCDRRDRRPARAERGRRRPHGRFEGSGRDAYGDRRPRRRADGLASEARCEARRTGDEPVRRTLRNQVQGYQVARS